MDKLLPDIEAFCDRHGIAESRFGLLALNDKAFVSQIRSGRRIWPETEARVRSFMDEYPSQAAA